MTDFERKQAESVSAVWLSHPFLAEMRKRGKEMEKQLSKAERKGKEREWEKRK